MKQMNFRTLVHFITQIITNLMWQKGERERQWNREAKRVTSKRKKGQLRKINLTMEPECWRCFSYEIVLKLLSSPSLIYRVPRPFHVTQSRRSTFRSFCSVFILSICLIWIPCAHLLHVRCIIKVEDVSSLWMQINC